MHMAYMAKFIQVDDINIHWFAAIYNNDYHVHMQ